MSGLKNQGKIIIGGIALVILMIFMPFILKWAITSIPQGAPIDGTQLSLPAALETPLSIIFGEDSLQSVESLVLFLAVFLILFVALADIINAFSTFNEISSWGIAFGVAIIGSVSRVVEAIVGWFGLTARVGAIGIGLIIMWAIVVAVAVNFLIGWSGLREMRKKGADLESISNAASRIRKGYGVLDAAADQVDKTERENKS